MSLFKLLLYQLYLLQLENYDLGRFWRVSWHKLRHHPFDSSQRQTLIWTVKAGLIFVLSCILALVVSWGIVRNYPGGWSVVILVLNFIIFSNLVAPIFLSLAVILLWPFDFSFKQIITNRAKRKIAAFKNLKIIGITGSFGKTTMKEVLSTILREKFKVLKTPENINTPVGIARLIINKLESSIEIFIVEMGAYRKGDIKKLCEIVQPDIAILTGINEAHLERFGNVEDTIATKFEIVEYSKPNALLVLNKDSGLVFENYSKYTNSREILWYQNSAEIPFGLKVPILGSYISGVLNACVILGKELGLSEGQIRQGISKIQSIPHRLQIIKNPNGITVIDDSYNGNPAGVTEAIRVLAGFNNQRKIYITPGLVEMGKETKSIHQRIGEQLANTADLVILIRNSVTPFIAQGLREKGFMDSNIIWFESAMLAHASLGKILKPGDAVMFQNDWPDNYL